MEKQIIDEKTNIDKELLDEYYARMEKGQELFIYRKGKNIDQGREGLLLIKSGFEKVVKMRECDRKGCILIKCAKGDRVTPKLSVIVPMYNEGNTADELLTLLIGHKWIMDVEIIIVESNSTDGTREIAKKHAEQNPGLVKLILEDGPKGKGNAVLNGISKATGNYYAIQDGDLEYKVDDYDRLLKPIVNEEALFVLGSRYRKDDWKMRKFSEGGNKNNLIAGYLNVGQKLLTGVINVACSSKLTDPFTMYKIFHKDCMYGINFKGGKFGLDWEIVTRFLRKGYVPVEMEISYKARSYSEGKKVDLIGNPIEGLKALWRSRFVADVYDYGDR
ncbi:MAG: glycosyltransferase family 2 protein [Lachnospiraceae bacterium]|nr:glycosyltransferase family 2 protein [Lachnospiraceae bacterium]